MSLPQLPPDLPSRGSTRTFTESDMPDALLNEHSLGKGRWGVLRVLEGRVAFVDLETEREHLLEAPAEWIIEPERTHHLRLEGPVRCRVDFFGAAKS